jgi:Tol biopolymer transport system component
MSLSSERLTAALDGRYRIERELGAGGMATVYLAADLKHDRKVAIKVLKPELAAVLGAERFVQEIKTTAALSHPHILPLFDSGEAGGFLYYVMPFIEGETIRERLNRETQLGIDEAVRITTEVADALDYAHRHGVIHRDIKPENILLHDGRPMVMDFGIALAVSAAAGGRMTETGLSLGTPHYMSPEQATADKDITVRSDVYSLASVLYEMLAGEPPHSGGSAQAIIMKIIAEVPRPVTDLRRSVPAHVASAVMKALEKLPADRFEGARAFSAALADPGFRSDTSFSGAARGAAPLGSSRATVAALSVAVLATVTAAWGWLRPAPVPALLRYSMAIAGEGVPSSSPSMVGGRVAVSPDGRHLVVIGGDGSIAGPALYVHDRTSLTSVRLAGTAGVRRPVFSPSGDRIAYLRPDGALFVIGVSGEPPRQIAARAFADSRGLAWSNDGYLYGSSIASITPVLRVREAGGAIEPVTVVDTAAGEAQHLFPFPLPGGGVLFTIRGAGAMNDRIGVVDQRTGRHHVLVDGIQAWYAPSGHLLVVTRGGALMAAPFDAKRRALRAPLRFVADSVGFSRLGADLAISASGTLAYMSGTAGYGVQPLWVDRSGRGTPVAADWTFLTSALYSSMALSPNGSRLVVSVGGGGGQQLHVKRLPDGPAQQVTFEGTVNARASWVDDRTLLYVSDRDGINRVWMRVADGSTPATLVWDGAANEGLFNRDRSWFIYRGVGGSRHIYARRMSGDTTTMVVAESANGEDLAPNLSPDGRWLLYVSTESSRAEVYLKAFPEVTRFKTQVSVNGGLEPRWSRDGREILFRSSDDELVSIPVTVRGDSLLLGERHALFSMREFAPPNLYQPSYDVSPDGLRFLMGGRRFAGAAREQLIVVENFLKHLPELIRP